MNQRILLSVLSRVLLPGWMGGGRTLGFSAFKSAWRPAELQDQGQPPAATQLQLLRSLRRWAAHPRWPGESWGNIFNSWKVVFGSWWWSSGKQSQFMTDRSSVRFQLPSLFFHGTQKKWKHNFAVGPKIIKDMQMKATIFRNRSCYFFEWTKHFDFDFDLTRLE